MNMKNMSKTIIMVVASVFSVLFFIMGAICGGRLMLFSQATDPANILLHFATLRMVIILFASGLLFLVVLAYAYHILCRRNFRPLAEMEQKG